MMDPASRQACVKEVKILQNVEHPNIVKCFRSFLSNENNELVIVLEWAEGGDLGHVIKQRQELGQAFTCEQVWVQFQQVRRLRMIKAGGGLDARVVRAKT